MSEDIESRSRRHQRDQLEAADAEIARLSAEVERLTRERRESETTSDQRAAAMFPAIRCPAHDILVPRWCGHMPCCVLAERDAFRAALQALADAADARLGDANWVPLLNARRVLERKA